MKNGSSYNNSSNRVNDLYHKTGRETQRQASEKRKHDTLGLTFIWKLIEGVVLTLRMRLLTSDNLKKRILY